MIGQYEWIGLTNAVIRSVHFELARDGCAVKFVGPETALAVSRQNIRRRIRCWLVNQHCVCCRGLGDTQRQDPEVISGPSLGAKSRFLSFSRTISRAVTVLPTGHNTLRKHLHLMGLSDRASFRRRAAEGGTSAHILR